MGREVPEREKQEMEFYFSEKFEIQLLIRFHFLPFGVPLVYERVSKGPGFFGFLAKKGSAAITRSTAMTLSTVGSTIDFLADLVIAEDQFLSTKPDEKNNNIHNLYVYSFSSEYQAVLVLLTPLYVR